MKNKCKNCYKIELEFIKMVKRIGVDKPYYFPLFSEMMNLFRFAIKVKKILRIEK